jgi:hypothetical protein
MRPSLIAIPFFSLLAGCVSPPQRTQSLAEANFSGASVTGDFTLSQNSAVAPAGQHFLWRDPTLTLFLTGLYDGAEDCPIVDDAVATVNGVPMHLDNPGVPRSACYNSTLGSCGIYESAGCVGPQWSLANPPAGPLSIVVRDRSRSYELDVGDMGSPRTIAVARSSDGTTGRPGAVTLTWSPASDATGWTGAPDIDGMMSGIYLVSFHPADAYEPYMSLSWQSQGASLPPGVTATGPDITADARSATLGLNGGNVPFPGGPGVFSVVASSLVRPTRCDWRSCRADVQAIAAVQAEWRPF